MTEPLVPNEVDLRELDGFKLNVERLFSSELWALSTGDEFKAALALWCRAWKQVPAGSLPDDNRILANFSGAGSKWKKVREMALRGFIKCSDGRLYHPVLCEDVLRAWELHKQYLRKREASRLRLQEWRERHNLGTNETPDETHFETHSNDISKHTGNADETPKTRQGQDNKEGYISHKRKKIPKKEKSPFQALTPDGYPVEFEEFWAAYPRKVDKLNACKAWEKAIDGGEENADIIEGAKRYSDACRSKGTEPEFIAHAATWLNGERWKDETFSENPQTPPEAYRAHAEAFKAWLASGKAGPEPKLDDFRGRCEP